MALMFRSRFRQFLRAGPAIVGLTAATIVLGILALVSPLGAAESPAPRSGFLLAVVAGFEVLHGIRRSSAAARRQASASALISMVIALTLINAPFIAGAALLAAVAFFFVVDAVRYLVRAVRETDGSSRGLAVLAMLGNLAVALLLMVGREWAVGWTIAVAVALRIFGTAWNLAVSPVHTAADAEETVVAELGFAEDPRVAAMAKEVEASEAARASIDRGWILSFVATLFAIHIGRMGTDRTLLGLLAPAVAVLGDMFIATLITLLLINPLYLLWRWPTRWIERPMWRWYIARDAAASGWLARLASAWLRRRLLFAVRMRAARYSIRTAVNQALQYGLPLAAVLAATGADLGHELVLRYRELGRRHVEFVGGIADRRMAGRDGPRGPDRGSLSGQPRSPSRSVPTASTAPATSPSSSSAIPVRATRPSTSCATSCCRSRINLMFASLSSPRTSSTLSAQ